MSHFDKLARVWFACPRVSRILPTSSPTSIKPSARCCEGQYLLPAHGTTTCLAVNGRILYMRRPVPSPLAKQAGQGEESSSPRFGITRTDTPPSQKLAAAGDASLSCQRKGVLFCAPSTTGAVR